MSSFWSHSATDMSKVVAHSSKGQIVLHSMEITGKLFFGGEKKKKKKTPIMLVPNKLANYLHFLRWIGLWHA